MSAPHRAVQERATPLDRMIDAVGIERDAVARKSRANIVMVSNGARTAQHGAGATYTFECTSTRPADDDRVLGEYDGVRVDGVVVGGGKGTLTIALQADLGPSIAAGRLMIDKTILWSTLRDRLEQLRSAPGPFNLDKVRLLTGELPPIVGLGARSRFADHAALNDEQDLLYRQARGSTGVFGWGPPGTGKTVVSAHVISDGCYADKESCLYTGPTNKAVDLGLGRILERLAETGQLEAALAAGHIVRVGPIADPKLRSTYGAHISLDVLVAARLVEIAYDRDGEGREALVAEEIIRRARIIVTTVHRVYMGQVPRIFDTVVLDEAGMITLPAACCAAAHARSHVVVMGDFRQLPAITTSEHPSVKEWVARDAFHATGVVDAVERGSRAPGLVALRVQHRSDPAIAAVVNAMSYKHSPLITHQNVFQRPPLQSPWGAAPLMLIDSTPFRPFVRTGAHGESRSNPVHAALVRWWLQELDEAGGLPADPAEPEGVVVLTPFRRQVKLLRRHLPERLLAKALDVSTVHRYQGDERDTVVFDCVDARGLPRLSRFMQAATLDHTGARLVNVACSRARRRLVVIASVAHLLRQTRRGPIHDFLRYVSRHAMRIDLPPELAYRALTYVDGWDRRVGH